jgi:hypothetical protein
MVYEEMPDEPIGRVELKSWMEFLHLLHCQQMKINTR